MGKAFQGYLKLLALAAIAGSLTIMGTATAFKGNTKLKKLSATGAFLLLVTVLVFPGRNKWIVPMAIFASVAVLGILSQVIIYVRRRVQAQSDAAMQAAQDRLREVARAATESAEIAA